MACTTTSSGQSAAIAFIEEQNCGVTPSILTTPVTLAAFDKTGAAAGTVEMDAPGGTDWVVDANIVPGHYLVTTGYSNSTNNGTWKVLSVTASVVVLEDTNDVAVDEVSGGTQSVIATMQIARLTERNINLEIDTLTSEEVRPSRQVADVRGGFNQVTGSLGFQLSPQSFDDFIRAAMYGEWVQPDTSGAGNLTVDADAPVAGQTTITRTTGNWADDGIRAGDILVGASFSNGTNNVQWRVLSVSGQDVILDGVGVDEGPTAATLSFVGYRIDLGPDPIRTFTIERRFEDVQEYQVFRGVAMDTWSLEVTPESLVNGSHDVLGMSSAAMSASPLVPLADLLAAPTTNSFASFDAVLYEGGAINNVVTNLNFDLSNNASLEGVIGSRFSPGVYKGTATVEGNVTFFLDDSTTYNKFYNETETSIFLKLQDPDNTDGFLNVVMPRVRLLTGNMDPPQEGPVPISMDFQALAGTTTDENGASTETSLTVQVSSLR